MKDVNVLAMFREIAQKVDKTKEIKELTRDTKVMSLGFDSVAMMEIIGEIEDELDITIPDEKLARLETVGDIEQVVTEQLK